MQSPTFASRGTLGRKFFAIPLVIGVLTAYGETACADDLTVTVTVQPAGTSAPHGGACSVAQDAPGGQHMICVDQEPATTKGNQGTPVSVTWNIATGGWAFAPAGGGIDIKKKKNWNVTAVSRTQYKATNTKEDGNQKYSYTINVLNGGRLLTWDPTIKN